MHRRELLKAAGAGVVTLAAPQIGRSEKINKLVFVPTEDLSVLDPVVTTLKSTRNHGYLVFDTLYGIDTNWMAQPQMVAGHQVAEDGLIWTLTLREGLPFTTRSRCWPAMSSPASAALPHASALPMR